MDPYRTQPSRQGVPRASRLGRAWHHPAAALFIVASAPIALVALCEAARVFVGTWFMPGTIDYGVGYAAFVLCVCAIDVVRR